MLAFSTAFLAFVASAWAYSVTSPNTQQGWTTAGPNVLSWQRVDTDPSNFTAVLSNQNTAIMPVNNLVMNSYVDGTTGSVVCNAPNGVWPVGDGFQVNLVDNPQEVNAILAQSNQFSIVQSTSSSSSSSSASSSSSSSSSSSQSSSLTSSGTQTTSSGTNYATSTSSDTTTSPTNTSGATTMKNVGAGSLIAAVLLAAFAI